MFSFRRILLFFAATAVVLLSGCKVELHSKLNEVEANSMMAALVYHSIPVKKVIDKDGVTLFVDESQFGAAVQTLSSLGLPQKQYQSVGQVFDAEGLVASPLQEWARLNYARSQELSQSISTIQGVTNVNVHIAESRQENSFQEVPEPSASVLVQMREQFVYDDLVPQIKQLVSFAIPDIGYENVGVIITPIKEELASVQLSNIGGMIVHSDSAILVKVLTFVAAVTSLATLLLGSKVGFDWFTKYSRNKKVEVS